ncbi:hypothetical protein C3387_19550 [Leclercia sp. LSNIH6]|nr:hypothetical protein C3370_16695 [Leclercia sp. LSNIH7]POU74676.1 hypothetical protein C3387_19550 [Leclercia sp. LSNIH6]POW49719.1 hypothetical protein C3406_19450 [Leclercia sp. LSNIH8]
MLLRVTVIRPIRTLLFKSNQNSGYRAFPLPVNDYVTYSIVFFYIWNDLFSRCLYITSAFSPVRFNVHGI